MKKQYLIAMFCFLLICLLLPSTIDRLYDIGETNPIIVTPYTRSDMLSYAAAVIGLIISMIALFVAQSNEDPKFSVSHARTVNSNDESAVYIQVFNESNFDCHVMSIGLSNTSHNRHINISKPVTIPAKGCTEIIISARMAKKLYASIAENSRKGKVFYEIRLGVGKAYYLDSKDLSQYLVENTIGA